MSEDLVKLQQRLQGGGLLERIKKPVEPERKPGDSALLIDCSYSMTGPAPGGIRKVDAMRKVVEELRQSHDQVPMIGFGLRGGDTVAKIDRIPEPAGGTPIAEAIKYAKQTGATHLVLISDGVPNNAGEAMEEAGRFGGPIDTFYIGLGGDDGARFMAEIAKMTGGQAGVTDLGKPKELAGKIVALLGDGSKLPAKKGAIQL